MDFKRVARVIPSVFLAVCACIGVGVSEVAGYRLSAVAWAVVVVLICLSIQERK